MRAIKDYKIAVVKIGDMTINEVAPIFERINSTGRKLTIVDLMRAATWKGGFDLNDAINAVRNVSEEHDYFNIPDSHILRNISACAGLGINREDIDKLRLKSSEELSSASSKCSRAYAQAIDFLKSNFPLPTYDFMPYALQLTFLVEFFNLENAPTQKHKYELIKWFWATAISRHFGNSNTGQNSRDLESIRKFARDKTGFISFDRDILLDRFVFDEFRLNIANSKSFSMLLAQRKPLNLLSGQEIDISEVLSVINRFDFHHIVPLQLFPESKLNVCVNICLLNKRDSIELSNQRPSQCFQKLLSRHGDSALEIFKSNYIDQNCLDALLQDNIQQFLNSRKELIRADIEKLTRQKTIPKTELISEKYIEDEDEDI